MSNEEEIAILKRKLAETEARCLGRLLAAAKEVLPSNMMLLLLDKIKNNSGFDVIQVEREIAGSARHTSKLLVSLQEAVKLFESAKRDFDDIQSGYIKADSSMQQRFYDEMMVRREKCFALASEYDKQKEFELLPNNVAD